MPLPFAVKVGVKAVEEAMNTLAKAMKAMKAKKAKLIKLKKARYSAKLAMTMKARYKLEHNRTMKLLREVVVERGLDPYQEFPFPSDLW